MLGRCDASTEHGCGGFWLSSSTEVNPGPRLRGFSYAWSEEDRNYAFVAVRESTGVFEIMGAGKWFDEFAHRCSNSRLQFEMDNREAAKALEAGYSKTPKIMQEINRIRSMCVRLRINLRVHHILAEFNSIGDLLSHDRINEAQCQAMEEFGVEMVL
jgi:hypothetical protein